MLEQDAPSPSPLFDRLTLAAAAQLVAWPCLFLSCVLLAEPIVSNLFARDGLTLEEGVRLLLERVRLVSGTLGLVLLAAAYHSRRLQSRRLSLRRGDVVLALAAAVVFLLLGEAALRIHGWLSWGSFLSTPLPYSAMRGSGEVYLRPGVYGLEIGNDYQPVRPSHATISINRYGLRGPLPQMPKPPGRTRIVCLGGSSTFGFVGEGQDYPSRLKALLAARGDFDVLNAGRPGSTTWSDLRYLRDRLLPLSPDVLLVYEGFNDMWRGVRRHAGEQDDYGIADERLPAVEEPLDLGTPRTWSPRLLFAAFHVGRGLESRFPTAKKRTSAPPAGQVFRFDPAIVSIYERNLAAIVRLGRSRGLRVALATFAACDDPSRPEAEQRLRLKYVIDQVPPLDVRSGQEGMDLYRQVTRQVAVTEGVPLLDLARLMPKDLKFYSDTIHLTAEGEETLATLLASELERELL